MIDLKFIVKINDVVLLFGLSDVCVAAHKMQDVSFVIVVTECEAVAISWDLLNVDENTAGIIKSWSSPINTPKSQ